MSKLTAAQAGDKWRRRASGATQDYVSGVQSVTTSPMAQAAAKQDKLVANFNRSITEGKWKAGLARVSLEDWKAQTANVGGSRYSGGIEAAAGKMTDFFGELLPYLDNVGSQIDKMPDTTPEDNINRMVTHARLMMKFKRTR